MKWLIPKHRPKGIPEWERADRNHGKRFKLKRQTVQRREAERKEREYLAMRELAKSGVDVAKVILGTCNRKKSLPLDIARKCARAARLETGRDAYVYECAFCGRYHLTVNPQPGAEYVYSTKGLKV